MKIITSLYDDNDNVLAKIETIDDLDAHEEKLYKIQHAIDEAIDSGADQELLDQTQ